MSKSAFPSKTANVSCETPEKLQVPSQFSVWRYVIYRRTLTQKTEFLIDFWGGRATFDPNPVKAKITGYSWLYKEEAEAKWKDISRICVGEKIGVARLNFTKDENLGWTADGIVYVY